MPSDPRFPSSLPIYAADFSRRPEGRAWLESLPGLIRRYEESWQLRLGAPLRGGSASWVAPATTADGEAAILKVSWPHREAREEGTALEFWAGAGAIRLLRADREHYALLLERCEPGTILTDHAAPPEERLRIGAEVLAALWSHPAPAESGFEQIADVCAEWADLAEHRMAELAPPFDPGLVRLGADQLRTLPASAGRRVVVHGDANPGNILAAQRAPWLAIDPKSMVGDPGYDPAPLILQIDPPFEHADPDPLLRRRFALVADIAGEPVERLLAWSAARAVEAALWYVANDNQPDGEQLMREAAVLARLAGL
ncbi:MAG TPA: aminoglycoside phosphotransferase family protein [Mycobacteriales bacterium]|nr:aminoglycoside phosphotransferase family protein [Mycobacteriales bacterium]